MTTQTGETDQTGESDQTSKSKQTGQTAAAGIAMVTIDCADPKAMSDFWAPFLGLEVTYADDNAVMLSGASGPALGFGRTDDYQAPAWPDTDGRKQFHLDLKVDDIAAAEQAAVALGATVADPQPGETWRVLLDPAGHPFCLATWQ